MGRFNVSVLPVPLSAAELAAAQQVNNAKLGRAVELGDLDSFSSTLLLTNALPNFYFHCTTAYDILRQCGIELGKRDFMGTPVSL